MMLRLQLPHLDRKSSGARVLTWHKDEGDPVDYGDPILDVRAEGVEMLEVPRNAQLLSRLSRLRMRRTRKRTTPLTVAWRITSSDRGTLARIVAEEGDYCEVGSVMALASSGEGEQDPATVDAADLPKFRVVVSLLDEDPGS